MEKEKIQQFLELLDGASFEEWEVLRRNINLMYNVMRLNIKLNANDRAVAYFAKSIYDGMKWHENTRSEARLCGEFSTLTDD